MYDEDTRNYFRELEYINGQKQLIKWQKIVSQLSLNNCVTYELNKPNSSDPLSHL